MPLIADLPQKVPSLVLLKMGMAGESCSKVSGLLYAQEGKSGIKDFSQLTVLK